VKRREFITLLGAAAAWPLAARAQQAHTPVIGLLNSSSPDPDGERIRAFRRGLSETGYIEGRNVNIEYRWADGHNDRLPAMAADLVRRSVDVIVTGGTPATLAAKAATTSIPIVFTSGFDPVGMGLVSSLNNPGGNVTGVSFFAAQLSAKRIGILRQLAPSAPIALLINPNNPNAAVELADARAAAELAGQSIRVLNASSERDLDDLAASFDRERPGALLVGSDPFFVTQRLRTIALMARYAIPAMYNERQIVLDGGLLSYGASIAEAYRQAGVYAGKILNGAKPAELPVLQPTKFELVINMKTAKTLGIEVPISMQMLADEVIE
jgi:putative tryptophan/tyrosine transport system substrate-binding protein